MTWTFVKDRAPTDHRVVTLDGYLIAYCRGTDPEAGKVRVVIFESTPGQRPVPVVMHGGTGDAVVRCAVQVHPGTRNPVIAYRRGAFCFFTLQGWVDERSNPLAIPWEIAAP
jgi:hypothetical protein